MVHGIMKMGSDFPLPHGEGTLRLASALCQSEDVPLDGGYSRITEDVLRSFSTG